MPKPRVHIVQLRLTSEEFDHVVAIARLRNLTVEELLREELRFSRRDATSPPAVRARLRVVGPRPRS
jgi:hypothetical protein